MDKLRSTPLVALGEKNVIVWGSWGECPDTICADVHIQYIQARVCLPPRLVHPGSD